jgi:hypothetical protein
MSQSNSGFFLIQEVHLADQNKKSASTTGIIAWIGGSIHDDKESDILLTSI